MVRFFDVVFHQKQTSDTKKMQYLKASLTKHAKFATSGMGFKSQSYYHAWDTLFQKYGRSNVSVKAHFKKMHTHPRVGTIILRETSNLQMCSQM